jgi:hypothetical protein
MFRSQDPDRHFSFLLRRALEGPKKARLPRRRRALTFFYFAKNDYEQDFIISTIISLNPENATESHVIDHN